MKTYLKYVYALAVFMMFAVAKADEAGVEFVCGTNIPVGAFYTDIAKAVCDGRTKDMASSGMVMCVYSASCTPATNNVRTNVLNAFPGKAWRDLSDDQINHALINLISTNRLPPDSSPPPMQVQCFGTKNADGNPSCPGVNDCVNDRKNKTLLLHLKPLKAYNPAVSPAENSDGVVIKVDGKSPSGRSEGVK